MKKVILIIIAIGVFSIQSYPEKQSKGYSLTTIYTQAITAYLKAVKETDKLSIDTLFVGPMDKDVDENISEIELPKEILKTKISKLTQEEGDRKVMYRKTFVFTNIIGIIPKERAEFMFITFIVEKGPVKAAWFPKHNSHFDFNYDAKKKEFVLEKQRYEYTYSNKYTEKK
jgi:hypothetical protein